MKHRTPILYNGLSGYAARRFYEGIDARFDSRPFTPSDEVGITRSLHVAFEDARDQFIKDNLPNYDAIVNAIVESPELTTGEAIDKLYRDRLGVK